MQLSLSQRIYNTTQSNPLFLCDFVPNQHMALDPIADSSLNSLPTSFGGGGLAILMNQDPEYLKWLKENQLLEDESRLIQVPVIPENYPSGSTGYQFLYLLKTNLHFRKKIISLLNQNSYALFPNFNTSDTVEMAQILDIPHGNIANNEQKNAISISETSHSKVFLRESAQKYGFDIPDGIIFNSLKELKDRLYSDLKSLEYNTTQKHHLSPEEGMILEYWLKFDNLSGGDGTINIKPPITEDKIIKIIKNVQKLGTSCGINFQTMNMPFILEIGANSIPGKEIIGNINTQALIGNNHIDFLDTTIQKTNESGDYLGNTLPFPYPYALEAIEQEYKKVCLAYHSLGYRGMMGGDAIVSFSNGKLIAEWFDINPRINGSQGFQEQSRILKNNGFNSYGINITLPITLNSFEKIKAVLGDDLFSIKTGTGVIPIASLPNGLKTSIFGSNMEEVEKVLARDFNKK